MCKHIEKAILAVLRLVRKFCNIAASMVEACSLKFRPSTTPCAVRNGMNCSAPFIDLSVLLLARAKTFDDFQELALRRLEVLTFFFEDCGCRLQIALGSRRRQLLRRFGA